MSFKLFKNTIFFHNDLSNLMLKLLTLIKLDIFGVI